MNDDDPTKPQPHETKAHRLERLAEELRAAEAARAQAEQRAERAELELSGLQGQFEEIRSQFAALRTESGALAGMAHRAAAPAQSPNALGDRLVESVVLRMLDRTDQTGEQIAMYELGMKAAQTSAIAEAIGTLGVAVTKLGTAMIQAKANERVERYRAKLGARGVGVGELEDEDEDDG